MPSRLTRSGFYMCVDKPCKFCSKGLEPSLYSVEFKAKLHRFSKTVCKKIDNVREDDEKARICPCKRLMPKETEAVQAYGRWFEHVYQSIELARELGKVVFPRFRSYSEKVGAVFSDRSRWERGHAEDMLLVLNRFYEADFELRKARYEFYHSMATLQIAQRKVAADLRLHARKKLPGMLLRLCLGRGKSYWARWAGLAEEVVDPVVASAALSLQTRTLRALVKMRKRLSELRNLAGKLVVLGAPRGSRTVEWWAYGISHTMLNLDRLVKVIIGAIKTIIDDGNNIIKTGENESNGLPDPGDTAAIATNEAPTAVTATNEVETEVTATPPEITATNEAPPDATDTNERSPAVTAINEAAPAVTTASEAEPAVKSINDAAPAVTDTNEKPPAAMSGRPDLSPPSGQQQSQLVDPEPPSPPADPTRVFLAPCICCELSSAEQQEHHRPTPEQRLKASDWPGLSLVSLSTTDEAKQARQSEAVAVVREYLMSVE